MDRRFEVALAARRVDRAEHRAAVHLDELSWHGVTGDGRAWTDGEMTIDICSRAREAHADLAEARSW